ncbi:MAG: hypothetical protein KGJ13_11040 [Patescibacteria group bacterium]|nr:hypothetical protein [Patescibacteria group bacterium]
MIGKLLSMLSGWQGYVAVAGLAALLAGLGTGYLVHKIDGSRLAALKEADAMAALHAVQRVSAVRQKQAAVAEAAAISIAREEGKLEAERFRTPERIVVHVQDRSRCISYGLIRVLNSTALGSGSNAGPIAPGQPDDACAPVTWRSFAADIADDYVTSRENSAQLNALEKNVRDLAEAQDGGH